MTAATPWLPLSRRTTGLGPDTSLHEGVPPHLRGVLHAWVHDQWRLKTAFQVGWRRELIDQLQWRLNLPTVELDELNDEQLLDVVDGILALWPARDMKDVENDPWADGERMLGPTSRLRELLEVGGSAWRVK